MWALNIRKKLLDEGFNKTAESYHELGITQMDLEITHQPLNHLSEHLTTNKKYWVNNIIGPLTEDIEWDAL